MENLCTGSCSFSSERGFCRICGLLLEELESWDSMTEEEQVKAIKEALTRTSPKKNEPRKPYK